MNQARDTALTPEPKGAPFSSLGASLAAAVLAFGVAACSSVAPASPDPAPARAAVATAAQPPTSPPAPARTYAGDPAAEALRAPTVNYTPPPGIVFRPASFFSENVRLTAQWFYAAENEGKKLPTVVMAHGWGGTAAGFRNDAVDLARAGYLVMVFDYRGWGESDSRTVLVGPRPAGLAPGATYTAEVRELRGYIDPWEQVEDWFNAISYVAAQPMVDPDRIGARGSSFSGGHVVYVAAHDPRVKAIVAQVPGMEGRPNAPYTADPAAAIVNSNTFAAQLAMGQADYPADRAQSVGSLIGTPIGNKVIRWAPVEQSHRVTQPVLYVMAEKEELFSNELTGLKSCEMVKGPRKAIMIPGISHYGIYNVERELAIKAAVDWFDRYLKPPGAATRIPVDAAAPARGDCRAPFVRPPGVGGPAPPPAARR
ncbi:alpha/beta fold hydrolase [bacterium]|nr:alpha/beta fold hydrolase [bacterium]